jgi:hypothetical protein
MPSPTVTGLRHGLLVCFVLAAVALAAALGRPMRNAGAAGA